MLFLTGYADYRTPTWQIAEYVARLRKLNQGNTDILMLTDMSSGHIGNTTGKAWIKQFAETYSFLHLNWQE